MKLEEIVVELERLRSADSDFDFALVTWNSKDGLDAQHVEHSIGKHPSFAAWLLARGIQKLVDEHASEFDEAWVARITDMVNLVIARTREWGYHNATVNN